MYCRLTAVLLACLAGLSCNRPAAPAGQIAILPFENLGSDPAADWMGRAFSEILIAELHATRGPQAVLVGHGDYVVRNGRLEATLTLEDTRTLKMVTVVEASGPADDPLGVASALAKQISPGANPDETVRALAASVEADAALARHDYQRSVEANRKSLAFKPDNPPAWNQLGYALAYSGDLDGAIDSLRHYQSLRPADPDPLDSQGDVYLLLGHLREAEDLYLQAAPKSPPDLYKAAVARLMTGDVAGADRIIKPFLDARPSFKALWLEVSGRRKTAVQSPPPIPILQQAYERANGASNDSERILLAWALVEAGRLEEAAPLLKLNPIPQLAGPGLPFSLYFPRIFELRARVAEKQGRAEDAQANRKLYRLLTSAGGG